MHRSRALRRGATLLEVVLASVILGMVAVSVTSAISFVARSDLHGQRKLGAYELANRVILQYLDDPDLLPSQSSPYDDGRFLYRWELIEEPLRFELPDNSISEVPTWGPGLSVIGETKLLRVRVYQGLPDGIGGANRGEQLAELARPSNPLMLMSRNPDARNRMSKKPAFLEMIRAMMGRNPGPAPVGPSRPATPGAPGTPGAAPSPTPGTPASNNTGNPR